jgi:hypothetical protein
VSPDPVIDAVCTELTVLAGPEFDPDFRGDLLFANRAFDGAVANFLIGGIGVALAAFIDHMVTGALTV